MTRRTLSQKGMTLIEMVITIGVASILIFGISQSMISQNSHSTQMRDYLIALNLARSKLSEIRSGVYPAVGTTTPAGDASFPGYIIQQVVTEIATDGARFVRQVEINIAKSGDTGFSSPVVRLVTQLSSVASFGDGV